MIVFGAIVVMGRREYLRSEMISVVVEAMVESGFDIDSVSAMHADGGVVTVDVDVGPDDAAEEGGFDERMDLAVETIVAVLHEYGFLNPMVERNCCGHTFVINLEKGNGAGMFNPGKLNRYLSNSESMDALDLVVKVVTPRPDPMYKILVELAKIGMVSKDIHYRASGDAFWSNHSLYDLCYSVGEKFDEISEVYYMGEQQSLPPMRHKVCLDAATQLGDVVSGDATEKDLVMRLHGYMLATVGMIEIAKTEKNPSSGVAAILDDISKDCLKWAGILKRRIMPSEDA